MKNETLKEQAYNYIKNKIVNCEYEPGSIINEELLQEEIDASRTPIRDAISRLEQENLVKILPKKGIMISELSIREVNEVCEIRYLVEPFAVQKYGDRIPEEQYMKWLKKFSITDFEKLSKAQMYELDDELHQTFIDASENAYLINIYNQISSQNKRLRILTGITSDDRMLATQKEHRKIVECCLDGDWEGASKQMKKHLQYSRKASFDMLYQQQDISI